MSLTCLHCNSTFNSNTYHSCPQAGCVDEPLIEIENDLLARKYSLEERIGKGGASIVHKATHITLHRQEAIKFLRASETYAESTEEEQRKFSREAELLAKLDHPNLVKVHDIDTCSNGTKYMAMEHIEGTTLKEYVEKNGPLSLKQTQNMFTEICDTLSYCHTQQIIHRDIKPDNILITPKGQVKIIDFGIAAAQNNLTQIIKTRTAQGTPLYCPPEQYHSKSTDAPTIDIFATGATLYFAITGQTPPNILFDYLAKGKTWKAKLPNDKKGLEAVIEKAMKTNPGERYQSVNELQKKIREATTTNPVTVRQAKKAYRTIQQQTTHNKKVEYDDMNGGERKKVGEQMIWTGLTAIATSTLGILTAQFEPITGVTLLSSGAAAFVTASEIYRREIKRQKGYPYKDHQPSSLSYEHTTASRETYRATVYNLNFLTGKQVRGSVALEKKKGEKRVWQIKQEKWDPCIASKDPEWFLLYNRGNIGHFFFDLEQQSHVPKSYFQRPCLQSKSLTQELDKNRYDYDLQEIQAAFRPLAEELKYLVSR